VQHTQHLTISVLFLMPQLMQTIVRCLAFLFLCLPVKAIQSAGWDDLLNNRFKAAEVVFARQLNANPRDTMALLGMMWLTDVYMKPTESATWLQRVVESVNDPYTVLNASMSSSRLIRGLSNQSSGLRGVMQGVIERPDPTGILSAAATARLADQTLVEGRVGASVAMHKQVGAILKWRMVGPFENISASGHDRTFPPELEDNPVGVYDGLSDTRIRWHEPSVYRPDGWVDFSRYYPTVNAVFYAVTYVHSSEMQRVQMRIGTSGSFKLFVNGSVVHESRDEHNNDVDTYRSEVTLGEGWNRVLVKCAASDIDRCNFLLRITDESGRPRNLETSTEVKTTSSTPPQPRVLENPFVTELQARIKGEPLAIHHRLMLAEMFLRNDEAALAFEVLQGALQLAPNSAVVLNALSEAYQRAGRETEVESTAERIAVAAPMLPGVQLRLFWRAINEDRMDDAEQALEKVVALLPGSVNSFDAQIAFARRKNRLSDVHRLQVEAFSQHPSSLIYMRDNVNLALQTAMRHDAAIAVVERHLESYYTSSGLRTLANIYRDAGRMSEWESTYSRMLETDPASPGFYVQMCDVFAQRKQFDRALEMVLRSIDVAPSVSTLWYRAGVYRQVLADNTSAENSFARALELDPANFDAREALRDITRTPSPWSIMKAPNIESAIATAPTSVDFPNDDVVVLLDDTRRIVYDGSRSEEMSDLLMRVLTVRGIDALKEMEVPYGGDGGFIVEKAVVVKPDGREIQADKDSRSRQLVFKSLEVGDVVWIRYKAREYRSGKLSKHFWTSKSFNSLYPALSVSLSLIVPKGHAFQWKPQNLDIQPKRETTPLGELYVWGLESRPAIEPEEGMPGLEEIGEWVHITSIPDWSNIVDWYFDIARTKARSSYETRTLMDSLCPRSEGLTELQIIERVYTYITSQIRYSSVPFRQSGHIPQKSRDVLVTRIGDCKDVASLCIAMLAERDISAWHVLVQTNTSPLQPEPLPSIMSFDHAIAMVDTRSGRMFLDLTAEHVPLGSVPFGDVDAFALVIKPGEKTPFRMSREFFHPNVLRVTTNVSLDADLSARIEQTVTNTGARTRRYRSWLVNKPEREVRKQFLELLASDYPDVNLNDYSITGIDTLSNNVTYTLQFTVPDYVIEAASARIFRVPWFSDAEPDDALSYNQRTYAYDFFNYRDSVIETIIIQLPSNLEPVGVAPLFSANHSVASCTVATNVANNTMLIKRSMVYNRSYVEPSEYIGYKSFYNSIVRHDRRYILLQPGAKGQRGRKR